MALAHAAKIEVKQAEANKLLFLDTDIFTTQAYAAMLFDKDLPVTDEILQVNRCWHYFFLDTDVEYVQDGTRLGKESWPRQRKVFLEKLEKEEVPFTIIKGGWQERLDEMVRLVNNKLRLNQ